MAILTTDMGFSISALFIGLAFVIIVIIVGIAVAGAIQRFRERAT